MHDVYDIDTILYKPENSPESGHTQTFRVLDAQSQENF